MLNFRKLKEKDENILPTEISTKKTIRNADDNIDAENTENIQCDPKVTHKVILC